jgi:hypothetical protein
MAVELGMQMFRASHSPPSKLAGSGKSLKRYAAGFSRFSKISEAYEILGGLAR